MCRGVNGFRLQRVPTRCWTAVGTVPGWVGVKVGTGRFNVFQSAAATSRQELSHPLCSDGSIAGPQPQDSAKARDVVAESWPPQ